MKNSTTKRCSTEYTSWTCLFKYQHQINYLHQHPENLSFLREQERTVLPVAYMHSYNDSCLNDRGTLLDTTQLNHLISFDVREGIIRCESGMQLGAILKIVVPKGWFLPVTTSTKNISVGGAIAHDVHGRNHYSAGTFGTHLTQFQLLRSDGSCIICSPESNVALFQATIGGMGLTGLIAWAEFKLKKIQSPLFEMETFQFNSFEESLHLQENSKEKFEHFTTWFDVAGSSEKFLKGLFIRGNHSLQPCRQERQKFTIKTEPIISIPFVGPSFLVNQVTVKLLNFFYFHKELAKYSSKTTTYEKFLYQLDKIGKWNRLLGSQGFQHYQFAIPQKNVAHIPYIIKIVRQSKAISFQAVMKRFGMKQSPGLLSFPMPGISLSMDFLNQGVKTIKLFKELNQIVSELEGKVYLAKNSVLDRAAFKKFYPSWEEFLKYKDPIFSSSFWRRITDS